MSDRFFGWNTIYGVEGEHSTPYLTRIWFGRLRLHIFHRGDADPDCHDHPWDFWTFPLTSYVEEVATRALFGHYEISRQLVRAFRLHYRPATHIHRVIGRYAGAGFERDEGETGELLTNGRRIITLVWTGKNRQPWAFLKHRDGQWCWTPWREYIFRGGKHAPCEPVEASGLTGNRPQTFMLDELATHAIAGLEWIDRPVTVTGGDYQYDGHLLLSFPKGEGGPIRYVVMDQNRRLFIHNATQCGLAPETTEAA
ncbi:hypothetical protein [Neorhizobium petrolearium]|uniref:Uncharacterized protein n=1 Tax=Neorhizobium petrolearium TaxID=515361 RepID=A0ABY8M2B1_9HYPH|nr:hypothetical protein [Neorhizobium petrolearium]MCC2608358.1 hypothetical protein [Neorhizobium petrolearium]WGI68637.1 hypothetical protein QEO92_00620 [Neorhizobium petrolearium]